MRNSARLPMSSYMSSGHQKRILKKKKGIANVVSNYSNKTAQTFANKLKAIHNDFYIE